MLQTLGNYYQPTRPPRRRFGVELLKFLGLFGFFFVLLSLIVMAPTFYTNISYYIFGVAENKYELPVTVPDTAKDIEELAELWEAQAFVPAEDTIIIPKINVDAPIIYMQSTDNKQILEDIKYGVGHYRGTALPGQVGNVFMTGHSSYYWWSGGEYNQVFGLLDKLKQGDLIYIYHDGGKYIYQVSKSFIISPNQVDILQPTSEPVLTLMTCIPLGTNLRRLIVQADLVGRPPVDTTDFKGVISLPEIPVILPLY